MATPEEVPPKGTGRARSRSQKGFQHDLHVHAGVRRRQLCDV